MIVYIHSTCDDLSHSLKYMKTCNLLYDLGVETHLHLHQDRRLITTYHLIPEQFQVSTYSSRHVRRGHYEQDSSRSISEFLTSPIAYLSASIILSTVFSPSFHFTTLER